MEHATDTPIDVSPASSRLGMLYPLRRDRCHHRSPPPLDAPRPHPSRPTDERLIQNLSTWLRGLLDLHTEYAHQFIGSTYRSSDTTSREFRQRLLHWKSRRPTG